MSQDSGKTSIEEDLTFLDMAIVLAEAWRALLLIPVATGLVVAGAIALQNPAPSYSASAEIWISDDIARVIHSDHFLQDVAATMSAAGNDLTWQDLSKAVSVYPPQIGEPTIAEFYTLEVRLGNAQRAEDILGAIVAQARSPDIPDPTINALRAQLEYKRSSEKSASDAVDYLLRRVETQDDPLLATDLIVTSSAIVNLLNTAAGQTEILAAKVNSWPDRSLQSAISVRRDAQSAKWAIGGVLSAFSVGFFLIIVLFVRAGIRRAAQFDSGRQKLAQLRSALKLSKRTI